MPKKYSVSEIKAVAEAAITARHVADGAKKAFEDAAGSDTEAALKTAYEQAESAATEAKTKADALSQDYGDAEPDRKRKVEKLKRKKHFINEELRDLGESDDDEGDVDEDDDLDDPDRPITMRDLQRIEARKAAQTAVQMANAIDDAVSRDAVREALKSVVPSGDPEKDFRNAVAIANQGKNSKILEEAARRISAPQHRSGAGAPPRKEDEVFVPTAEEAAYMRPPFSLTKEQILASRPK